MLFRSLTINTGSFTRTDGSTGSLGDVALAYDVTSGTQHTQDVGKIAVSDDPSWMIDDENGVFGDYRSRFASSDFARPYDAESRTFDAASFQAANLMVQAMSTFGIMTGVDGGGFKNEAGLGGEAITVLDRSERYGVRNRGYDLA